MSSMQFCYFADNKGAQIIRTERRFEQQFEQQ